MKISNRDWAQLSAYLDGELSLRENKRLEGRLHAEPDLQFALEELRLSKQTLRSAPRLRPPRNFSLTPEMVGIKTSPRPVQGFRLASALMMLMLVAVLVLDVGAGFISGSMAPAAPKEAMLEALPESAADAVEEPSLLAAEGQIEERAVEESAAEPPAEEEAPAAEAAAEAAEIPGAGEEGESLGLAQDAETKSGDDEPDAADNQADEWQEEDAAEALVEPTQTMTSDTLLAEEPQATPPPIYLEYAPVEEDPIRTVNSLRILEIGFGLAALGFGIAAWVLRKKG